MRPFDLSHATADAIALDLADTTLGPAWLDWPGKALRAAWRWGDEVHADRDTLTPRGGPAHSRLPLYIVTGRPRILSACSSSST